MTEPDVDADLAAGLSRLHAEAFDTPWDSAAFRTLLAQPGVWVESEADGFILLRQAADEAEVLTLAVRPSARRRGLGLELTRRGIYAAALRGVRRLFLEVAEGNAAARALYARAGFIEAGRRPRYYARADGAREDALLLALNLDRPLP